jgi:hypothetical protein
MGADCATSGFEAGQRGTANAAVSNHRPTVRPVERIGKPAVRYTHLAAHRRAGLFTTTRVCLTATCSRAIFGRAMWRACPQISE